jgi:hypothetical protein
MDFKKLNERSNDYIIDLYFEYIGKINFLTALEEFSHGSGFGILDAGCEFAQNFKNWEEGYFGDNGVQILFSPPLVEQDESFVINADDFFRGIERAITRFGFNHLQCEEHLKHIREKVK